MNVKKVFIVAGEASGDILGAGLISKLKEKMTDPIEFSGIAGDKMLAQGCISVYPLERLAVMGIIAVLKRYRELTRVRKRLIQSLIADPPDVFIGIDAPEFNLDFELELKKSGIKTVHYVSPSVWAWRPKRIFKIKKAVDHMLCLFTFEEPYYRSQNIPVTCVGHPIADQIPMQLDINSERNSLSIEPKTKVLAVLPGSRSSEIKYNTRPFIEAAFQCWKQNPNLQILVPLVNEKRKQQFERELSKIKEKPPIRLSIGNSRSVMAASNAILIASGTATLEATLLKKPMVVGYKMSGFSYAIFSRMLKIKNVSLPNLLAGKSLVPELIQSQCTSQNLFQQISHYLSDDFDPLNLEEEYTRIHQQLKKDADTIAADVVASIITNGQ